MMTRNENKPMNKQNNITSQITLKRKIYSRLGEKSFELRAIENILSGILIEVVCQQIYVENGTWPCNILELPLKGPESM